MEPTRQEYFTALMERHRLIVERYVHYKMPSSQDAEDVLQETWLSAYTHLEQLTDPAAEKAWLLTIARNQCALWYRKRYRREEVQKKLPTPVPQSSAGTILVRSVLAKLPRDTARILQLYYIQGYRQKEIAGRLGIPLGTVKSRLHTARERFRLSGMPLMQKGKTVMKPEYANEFTKNFPPELPQITIEPLPEPYTPIRFPEENFIIPRIGEVNSEGTYRYPAKKLALVSTCRVTKAACIHEADGVKVVRDTYNVRAGKLYRNENVWFTQMTDEYIRELGCLQNLEEDDEYPEDDCPTYITTFLDPEFNGIVNAEDPVRGMPLVVAENPVQVTEDGYRVEKYNVRCTLGMFRLTIGGRVFRAAGLLRVYNRSCMAVVSYVTPEGRLLLLRWYETEESIRENRNYASHWQETIRDSAAIVINGERYILAEDRIGEIVL